TLLRLQQRARGLRKTLCRRCGGAQIAHPALGRCSMRAEYPQAQARAYRDSTGMKQNWTGSPGIKKGIQLERSNVVSRVREKSLGNVLPTSCRLSCLCF